MLSDQSRKALTNARCQIARQVVDRTCQADLGALCTLDGLLLNDAQQWRQAGSGGAPAITFQGDAPSVDEPDTFTQSQTALAVPGDHDDPLDEVERLRRQREQDTRIIEGLRRELDKLKRGRNG